VTEEDVDVVLSRLPFEVRNRLRAVHFNDRGRGGRVLGYVNRGRREIALCALPPRMSLTRFLVRGQSPEQFGARRGRQWPSVAIRRFVLYDVFLHELGHLQIVHEKAKSERRKFSMETRAQEFAMQWCARLWAEPFDHPDPAHNKPTAEELADTDPDMTETLRRLRQHPDDAELFQRLAKIYHERGMADDERAALEKSLALGPNDPWTNLFLGNWHEARKNFSEAIESFARAVELLPDRSVAYWCLAGAYEALGNAELADANYRKATEVEPSDKEARTKLARWRACSIT